MDSSGNGYSLTISSAGKAAAYAPKAGDSYVLKITYSSGSAKTSSGTVASVSGATVTLKPAVAPAATFTVTIGISEGTMTAITGSITLEDKAEVTAPGTVTPGSPPASPDPAPADPHPAEGSGSSADPYIIKNADDLARIAYGLDKYYKLGNDFTISGQWTSIGRTIDKSFTGKLDGNDKTITFASGSSLKPEKNTLNGDRYVAGLFGWIGGTDAEVKNLTVVSSSHLTVTFPTDLYSEVGVITGFLGDGDVIGNVVITGCTVNAALSANGGDINAGAIAGANWKGTIENSRASGSVTIAEGKAAGGISGTNAGLIKNCYADVTVTANTGAGPSWWSWNGAGGITGCNAGIIENSYSIGAVNGFIAGGIAGTNSNNVLSVGAVSSGVISNCYAFGTVTSSGTGTWYSAGGIAGIHAWDATDGGVPDISISNCVALNTSVTSSVSSYTQRMLGRNVASGVLANNWGLAAGMTITGSGGAVTPGPNAAGVDGADFTNSGQASWSAAAGTGPAFAFGSSDAAPWVWDSGNNRPKLYWE